MTKLVRTIHFNTPLVMIKDWTIARIPEDESVKLTSRGQISVKGTINGHEFQTILEPDGYWSHWFRLDDKKQKELGVKTGDTVSVELTPVKEWPEPTLPNDIQKALNAAPEKVQQKWRDITPMARWEWVRWVNSTGVDATRAMRIEKTFSKLNGTHRRPCCFNLAACTEPYVSKSGRLMQPTA
ncbi:MAG: hypothetical protein QG549_669 [Patescibacteria group bacterium]|jgi:hypothetical protein|nr:hypothetical protein [Patescibacteria group bacterium]